MLLDCFVGPLQVILSSFVSLGSDVVLCCPCLVSRRIKCLDEVGSPRLCNLASNQVLDILPGEWLDSKLQETIFKLS